jgi:DNA mismatch repair protein MutS
MDCLSSHCRADSKIRNQHPDAILLLRAGDFFESLGEDAILASLVLSIPLSKRNNRVVSSDLLVFPHCALGTNLHKLVRAGYRVAICDQLEDAKVCKGIITR